MEDTLSMKATGIVRRIDDLGRVVIPKEIRRTMHIREGDPLEIYTDRDGEVIFKKYSPIGELTNFSSQYAETLNKTCGMPVAIVDRDVVVSSAGVPKKELLEKKISPDLDAIVNSRQLYTWKTGAQKIPVSEGSDKHFINTAMPILTEGDIIGAVVYVGAEDMHQPTDTEIKLVQTAAAFLGRQFES